ncbi:hypothetical protein ILUMI_24909 [Ignelater luminosus]|uniref:Chitin-binding type-2 domain-containing protein n=1 Tax=Ignelater luminosus TaxID=2038154 RepID=A0A8K0G0I9_IGNLU|nr:hypothetical protein ILUMI_24909 [Ignelater luminosus]
MRAAILIVVLIALVITQAQRFGYQQQPQKTQQSSSFGQQSSYSSRNTPQKTQQSSFFGQQSSFSSSRNTPQVPQQQQPKSNVHCPEKNGRFPTRTCDGYIECEDGVGEEKVCPDGLLFNPAVGIFHFPCQYPIDVDCTGRESTQPPQATEDCPHQYGYYRLGDAANCGQFKNCVDGRGYTFDCPEGLAFNEESYRCDWPDQVKTCDPEAYLGFTCPPGPDARGVGEEDYKSFRSPRDCQRYFICIDTKPRLYNCGEGHAFNEIMNTCDGIENVTGCSGSSSSHFDRKPQQFDRRPSSQYQSNKRYF